MTPEENLTQARANLQAWDQAHGTWNPARHRYEEAEVRTTQPQIRNMFTQVKNLAIQAEIPTAATWDCDYAPEYGGWTISYKPNGGGQSYLGGGVMDANRMPAGDFYRMLRTIREMFELQS